MAVKGLETTAVELKRILLAIDLQHPCEPAMGYAAALAARYSSTLELVTVIDYSRDTLAFAEPLAPALELMRESARRGLEDQAKLLEGLKTRVHLLEGIDAAQLLTAEAHRGAADLIVLGTSSKRGLERFLLGSTAEEVLRTASCPVLTVGPHVSGCPAGPMHFRKIVLATDLSSHAEKAFHFAVALASGDGAELSICRVIAEERGTAGAEKVFVSSALALRELSQSASARCKIACTIEHGNAAREILMLARRMDADLIVLAARRASVWLSYARAGLTPSLLAEAKCPIISLC